MMHVKEALAQWAERERLQSKLYYNRDQFPIFVAHHGNWDIYRNAKGDCAALPIPSMDREGGCRASHFGDMNYLKHIPDLAYVS